MSDILQIQEECMHRHVGMCLCEPKNQYVYIGIRSACIYEQPMLLVQNNCLQEYEL